MTHTEARELASQCGTRMCDENGHTHGEELYCFDLDDIIALKEALAQRTWVNLPDEEIKILWIQYRAALPRYLCFAKALLARAMEKNT